MAEEQKNKKKARFSWEKLQGQIKKIDLNNLSFDEIKVPSFFNNFYFIVTCIFLSWMFFFDSNDFITQYQRSERLEKLEKEKIFYKQGTKEIEEEFDKLSTSKTILEKFARENHFLKKPQEDVYIIVKQPKKAQPQSNKASENNIVELPDRRNP